MNRKVVLFTLALATIASFAGAFIYQTFFDSNQVVVVREPSSTPYARVSEEASADLETGFIAASKKSTPSVVFIKTESQYQRNSFWFFGFDPFGSIGKVAWEDRGLY